MLICRVANHEDDTPFLVRSIQGGGVRRYAVRKGLVRSTQKSCYIVRKLQILKTFTFHQETQQT